MSCAHIKPLSFIKLEHIVAIDKVGTWNQFENVVTKWKKDYVVVMFVGHFQHLKNRPTCKEKWSSISVDFKKFFDYMFAT